MGEFFFQELYGSEILSLFKGGDRI